MAQEHDYDRLRVYRAVADLMEHCGMTYDQAKSWISVYDERHTAQEQMQLELEEAEAEDRAYWNRVREALPKKEPADS